jgi:uncharacterized paraquat-inducible protein A
MTEQTVRCPICREPYKVYSMTTRDQSACPDCVAKVEKKMGDNRGINVGWAKIQRGN